MKDNNILLVGGTFDENGGKPSGLIKKIYNTLKEIEGKDDCITLYNGGFYQNIKHIFLNMHIYNIILWFPNIPNELPKIRNIKEKFPQKILVTSKRNFGEYSLQYLVNHALGLKSNLLIEFYLSDNNKYGMKILDPLGNIFYEGFDVKNMVNFLYNRINFLSSIKRQRTHKIGEITDIKDEIPNENKFFKIIKEYATVFHNLIHPVKNVTRFLGNASFRCERGFPGIRLNKNLIYVSQRNIDKRFIDKSNFVTIDLNYFKETGEVGYYGDVKPSVDSVIQIRLFDKLKNVNYILHSHVYIKNALSTKINIPCGGLQEVKEIFNLINNDYNKTNFYINLIGHGSIIFAKDCTFFEDIEFIPRPYPEFL